MHSSHLYDWHIGPLAYNDKTTSKVHKGIVSVMLCLTILLKFCRDKESALGADRKMVLLDGRSGLNTAPPSSVASYPSTALSAAKTQTLRRIGDLEGELMSARREREMLEQSIMDLKGSLRLGDTGPMNGF